MKTCWPACFFAFTAFAAALSPCPDPSEADYDFIVIGGGAGGGPLAARLAESGFSGEFNLAFFLLCGSFWIVLLVDAGHNTANLNTTLPWYALKSLEGMFVVVLRCAHCQLKKQFVSKIPRLN
jgi:choline dehydrogenase